VNARLDSGSFTDTYTTPHHKPLTTHTPHTAGNATLSPKTGEAIDPMLLPNLSLRNLIQTFVDEQRHAFRLFQQQQQQG
jgi:hypothetical protein